MSTCPERATLVITCSVDGTSTNVVRERAELACQLEVGHEGAHRDIRHGAEWEAAPGHKPTVLRHEDDKA